MTDPTFPPLPPRPPASSKAARRAVLLTAVLAVIGLSIAAWVLASTTDTDDDGEVGDAATSPSDPTETTPKPDVEFERYVALGDSMTSAPFLPEQEDAGRCSRSSRNYPSLVAETLEVPEFVDVSCGGATSDHMLIPQYDGVPPQLDAVTRGTDLVTLTLGGNDFGTYRAAVAGCVRLSASDPDGAPCRAAATASGEDVLARNIEEIGPRLEIVLREIHARAPRAEVVLIGYPRFLPESGSCPETLPFAAGDYRYVAGLMRQLNDAQSDAAKATDTEFLDMYAASAGHDPCSADPWMNGVHAVPGGAAAFHTFPEGQAAIAEELLALLD